MTSRSLLGMSEPRKRIVQAGYDYEASKVATEAQRRQAELTARAFEALRQTDKLSQMLNAIKFRKPKPAEIIQAVAVKHGLKPDDLTGTDRSTIYVRARQEAVWSVRQATKLSTPQIGKLFGDRDHTTVLYYINSHQAFLDKGEPELPVDEMSARIIEALKENSGPGLAAVDLAEIVLGRPRRSKQDSLIARRALDRVKTVLYRTNRHLVSSDPGMTWTRYKIAEGRNHA